MFARFLRLGVLAGALGGLALALTLLLAGQGPISRAIALEEGAAASGQPADAPMFSRTVQVVGGGIGAVVYGLLVGLVFGVAFAALRHRLPGRGDWHRSVALAAAGFASVALVPALKYPANPPAVGDPDTVGTRTALYLVAVGWALVSTWAAWRLAGALRGRLDDPARLTAAAAAWAALVVAMFALLPGSPDPVTAPAGLVWQFRVLALGGQVALWAGLGAAFGLLAVRRPGASGGPVEAVSPADGSRPERPHPAERATTR